MKIELGKTYLDNEGTKWRVASLKGLRRAEVLAVDDKYGHVRAYDFEGQPDSGPRHLVSEFNPWTEVKVDTPIWVRDQPTEHWAPRHFAKYENGRVYAWTAGLTAHSGRGNDTTTWAYATLENPHDN